MTSPPTVFVVDDDPSLLKGLRRLIKSFGLDAETFDSAEGFLARELPDLPSCLVLDIEMPGMNGLKLQERLLAAGVPTPIVFLTGHGDVPASVTAMKAGAIDFLQKPFEDEALLEAIHAAIEKDKAARAERQDLAEIQQRVDLLTPREREVFALVVTGLLNKQIAWQLGTVEKTIKVHRARVMQKMAADSLPDLVRMAEKAGITPDIRH